MNLVRHSGPSFNSRRPAGGPMAITRIWASDGWCYVPELASRDRFTETSYESEPWSGIIPPPVSVERLVRTMYSRSPPVWREKGEQADDVFEASLPSRST